VRGLGSGSWFSLAKPALATAAMDLFRARIMRLTSSADSGTRARSSMATLSLISTSCSKTAPTEASSPRSECSLAANSSRTVSSIGRRVLEVLVTCHMHVGWGILIQGLGRGLEVVLGPG
jgi:hypothetical protein